MKLNDTICRETAAGTVQHSAAAFNAANGIIVISEEITSDLAMQLFSLLKYYESESRNVTIYLDSVGGEVNAGLAIYDMLQAYPYTVDIYCVGIAASMAAILLAGGKKGHRFILPHSKVMIHEPLFSEGFGGSATTVEKKARNILAVKDLLNGILASHTGKSIEEINEATAYDHFLTAEEAVDFGICDAIRQAFEGVSV